MTRRANAIRDNQYFTEHFRNFGIGKRSIEVSLAVKYDAELWVIHVIDSWAHGWNFPAMPFEREHRYEMDKIRAELDNIIANELKRG